MALASRSGHPCGIALTSTSPAEVTLVERTLAERFTHRLPVRLIGDKAYDSDPLDATLHKRGIELIAPHKTNRTRPKTQDGRVLRRYRRRWKVERLFAWLYTCRRLIVRWECHAENFLGLLQLGCVMILLKSGF